MLIIRILRSILSLYTLVLIANFLIPYCTDVQKPWMVKLSKVCEPAVKMGRNLVAKLLPNRTLNTDAGSLMGAVVCLILSVVLGWLA